MAIVTLLTDSGERDHYVAAIKARVLTANPALTLIDISHQIPTGDIAQGAYVLRCVFRDFPPGTVHVVGVGAAHSAAVWVALQTEDHFFVGADNGLLGLVSAADPQGLVALPVAGVSTFPEREILAPAAAALASGATLELLGKPLAGLKRPFDRMVKANKRMISGHVIRVDHFGNLMTNIPREVFQQVSEGRTFTVQVGSERIRRLHTYYDQAEQGDCFVLFNSLGWLEIGIYLGNASDLLGLSYDSPVTISFDD